MGELARRAHAKITAHRKGTTQAHTIHGRSLAAARAVHSHEGWRCKIQLPTRHLNRSDPPPVPRAPASYRRKEGAGEQGGGGQAARAPPAPQRPYRAPQSLEWAAPAPAMTRSSSRGAAGT